jgi:hypothetical protein
VLDRYPSNGRILRAYGRFLEWVQNEPSRAQRYYQVGWGLSVDRNQGPGMARFAAGVSE